MPAAQRTGPATSAAPAATRSPRPAVTEAATGALVMISVVMVRVLRGRVRLTGRTLPPPRLVGDRPRRPFSPPPPAGGGEAPARSAEGSRAPVRGPTLVDMSRDP